MKIIGLFLIFILALSACTKPEMILPSASEPTPGMPDPTPNKTMQIKINDLSFIVSLEENATSEAFQRLLPMTIDMAELNGNEKFYYLQTELPSVSSCPGTIRSGDIMLYGSNTLVLFYETFETSYSYTKIATIDHPSGLPEALGVGDVTVKFEK